MARLVGVDLPRDKRMEVALTYIFGIGRTRSNEILAATGIDRDLRTRDLTEEQLIHLRDYIEANLKVEGDLRREVQADIRRKIEIGCYQGLRHRRGMPVRGQRTKPTRGPAKAPSAPSQARRRLGNRCHQQKKGRQRRLGRARRPAGGRRRTSRTAPPTSRARSTTRS
ncbi:30S ribosomal protein S13 [Mycobacterium tuberculosis]|nr:30S ribosomal protein S13 [Mycobacterium tuberculosis]